MSLNENLMGVLKHRKLVLNADFFYAHTFFTTNDQRRRIRHTVPTAEILSGKNERAWISMVLYLKKIKIKMLKQKNPVSRLKVAC